MFWRLFYARKKLIFFIGDSQHSWFVTHHDPQMVCKWKVTDHSFIETDS